MPQAIAGRRGHTVAVARRQAVLGGHTAMSGQEQSGKCAAARPVPAKHIEGQAGSGHDAAVIL